MTRSARLNDEAQGTAPPQHWHDKLQQDEAAKRDEEAKNTDFVQLSRKAMPALVALIAIDRTAAQILIFLAQRMSYMNEIQVAYEHLKSEFNVSLSTIDRAMKVLQRDKWLRIEKTGSARILRLNANAFWATSSQVKKSPQNFRDDILVVMKAERKKRRIRLADGSLTERSPAPAIASDSKPRLTSRMIPVVRSAKKVGQGYRGTPRRVDATPSSIGGSGGGVPTP